MIPPPLVASSDALVTSSTFGWTVIKFRDGQSRVDFMALICRELGQLGHGG